MHHVAINAHLLSGEATYRSAGIHGYIYNTLKALRAEDMRFTALVGQGHPPEGFAVHRSKWPTSNPMIRILWEQLAAPLVLRQVNPDLFHSMAYAIPMAWGGSSVVTIHDLSFIRYPQSMSSFRSSYLRLFTRLAVRRSKVVIAVSESCKQEVHSLLGIPQERIVVASPGVRDLFTPIEDYDVQQFRIQKGLPPRFILHVGTIEPRKNLDTLLKAYAQLPQRKNVKLVLVGGQGWQTEPIFALIDSLNLKDDVVFPGFVPDEDLPKWYAAAELFVYPSVYEGFGIPLIEASAMGTAVVAANTSSLPEAAGPHGTLIPPLDVDAWVDAMGHLLDEAEKRKLLGIKGREYALRFTWQQTAAQTLNAYRIAL